MLKLNWLEVEKSWALLNMTDHIDFTASGFESHMCTFLCFFFHLGFIFKTAWNHTWRGGGTRTRRRKKRNNPTLMTKFAYIHQNEKTFHIKSANLLSLLLSLGRGEEVEYEKISNVTRSEGEQNWVWQRARTHPRSCSAPEPLGTCMLASFSLYTREMHTHSHCVALTESVHAHTNFAGCDDQHKYNTMYTRRSSRERYESNPPECTWKKDCIRAKRHHITINKLSNKHAHFGTRA